MCGSGAILDVGAVFGREEAGDIAFRCPLNERYLSENGIAADTGYYGVDPYEDGLVSLPNGGQSPFASYLTTVCFLNVLLIR